MIMFKVLVHPWPIFKHKLSTGKYYEIHHRQSRWLFLPHVNILCSAGGDDVIGWIIMWFFPTTKTFQEVWVVKSFVRLHYSLYIGSRGKITLLLDNWTEIYKWNSQLLENRIILRSIHEQCT